jgi:fatty-acyl-CoA synthase
MGLTTAYWPADTSVPVLETTVGGVLRDMAARMPDALAMVGGLPDPTDRRRWTFADLLADSERTARALTARFQPGERIAVWAPNLPEWIVLEFGAALAGLTLVTVNPAYRPQELRHVLSQSSSAGIFLVREFRSPMEKYLDEVRAELPALRDVVFFEEWDEFLASGPATADLPDVSPDDIVQIQYTSGTTGLPKGAMLTHRGLTNNSRFYAERLRMAAGDVYVNPMPMFHTAGCAVGVLGTLQSGAVHIPVLSFDPALVLEIIETERVTATLCVPTMLIALMEHPDLATRDLSSLRIAVSGGSTVPADLVREIESRLGVRFSIVYGSTELSPIVTQTRPEDSPEDRANTLGQPLPQTEIMICDPHNNPVAPGEVGELCARGYNLMAGYNNAPEATAAAIDADGWYHTGDLASMDERGFFLIEGRLKDMIIRGGENIYPREIEDLLFGHPDIAEIAVVGAPDPRWGETVAAFVRAAPGCSPTEEQLRAYCREHLASYKCPGQWIFVDEFPLTPSGKIQKFKLRERLPQPVATS